jgi:hypothetical protein
MTHVIDDNKQTTEALVQMLEIEVLAYLRREPRLAHVPVYIVRLA